jgi:hypothetical protein
MGRVANADDVANVVELLASDKARYVTDVTFFVDSGITLLALVQVKTIIWKSIVLLVQLKEV